MSDLTGAASPRIRSHLAWAILATLLCSFPIGVAAVVYATRVAARLDAGDVAGARRASRAAWILASASALVAVGAAGLYLAWAIGESFTFFRTPSG